MSLSPNSDPESSISSLPSETLKAALDLWAQSGEMHTIPLRGTSMLPLLRDGDQVLVTHHHDEIQMGDIVVFQRADGLVAHRVLRVSGSAGGHVLCTKGDHVLGLDPELPEAEVVGRVLAIRRNDRMMDIATPAWRVTGRLVALVMLAQAWLYHKAGRADGKLPDRISMVFSRGIQVLGAFLVRACQLSLGRWQPGGDGIPD